MATPAYLSEPQIQSLSRLLQEILEGNLRLPLFQRDFVWSNNQRSDLLNSVRDGIPIGSALVWRTATRKLECFEAIGPHRLPDRSGMEGILHSYLLDGLQRLSTLLGSIYPRSPETRAVSTERSIGQELNWDLYYDLEERVFRFQEGDEAPASTWQPLWLTLDSIGLLRFQRELAKHPDAERLIAASDELVSAFRDYKIPVLAIVTEDLEQATRIFHRINSRGTPMGEFHMMQALTWREGFDLRERLTLAKVRLKERGWEPEPEEDLFLDVCKAALDLDVFEEAVEALSKRLQAEPRVIDEATDNVLHAVSFLQQECGILSAELLPTRYQLILLADAMRTWRAAGSPAEVKRHLIRWFWLTTYGSTFRAVNGSKLQRLLLHLRRLASGETTQVADEIGPYIPSLPERFHYRSARSKVLALHLARLGPRSVSGQPIEGPTALLARHGADAIIPLFRNHSESANRILVRPDEAQAMREMLQGKTLLRCSDEMLASHAISPEAANALYAQDIERFLALRGETLTALDNEFIKALFIEEVAYTPATPST
ncbi:DUF262 domain-containing protein [Melittangium boletus]|uniref:GmrSD restriction endonucleases N-terminal domain-containing protein n=1 Tax=Melittangium boletus DSM 14713 TaxID=1294270 RepID=A0A250ICE8_9BACT|nr:DUF262 domain-containing protein [Melittangium boletus]ATB29435.1 hypothetical protein MEBOL_002884 [Melittangium boletus DSM 14713]